jgi:glycerol-1-phosphatase
MTNDAVAIARIRAHAAERSERGTRARAIAAEIAAVGGYRWVGLYDVDDEAVTILGWSGGGAPAYPQFPKTEGLTSRAISRAETIVVDDVASDPGYLEAFGDTRSEAIVPVVIDGVVVGTIDVESSRPNAFGGRDRSFLERCATAAIGLWHETSPLDFDGLIIDLDGVIWRGNVAVPGSPRAVARLRAMGIPILFLTNDPRGSRDDYAQRLGTHGIDVDVREIVTAARALASVVVEREGRAGTLAIGSRELRRELVDAGVRLTHDEDAVEVVAVGGHDRFDYDELRAATRALRGGARLYAAGRDATFPMPDGPWPGTGAIVAAIEVAGGAQAQVVGKPEPYMFEIARSLIPDCGRVAIVGDNLASDIAGGARAGLTTILVLTGTHGRDDLAHAEMRPDYVFPDLAAVVDARARSTGL